MPELSEDLKTYSLNIAALEKSITEAYNALKDRTVDAALAAIRHANAVRALEAKRRAIVLDTADPKTLGANEAARQARLDAMCQELVDDVEETDRALANAKHELRMAELEVEEQRALLRLFEAQMGLSLRDRLFQ